MSELERTLEEVRAVDPPEGARDRIRRAATEAIERRGRRPRAAWLAAPIVAVAAFLVWMSARDASERGRVIAAAGATLDGEALDAGDAIDDGLVRVGRGGHVTLRVGRARIDAAEGAALRVEDGAVRLESGALEIDGTLAAKGGQCAADVAGRARLALGTSWMDVTVIAGSVEVRSPETTCRVVDLQAVARAEAQTRRATAPPRHDPPPPSEPAPAIEPGPGTTAAATPAPRPPQRDLLTEQVEAYRAAIALRGRDDAEGLRRLRAIQLRWPGWALSHEVDFAVLETLVRLGRHADARREAERFLARNPTSPRAEEVRRLIAGQ